MAEDREILSAGAQPSARPAPDPTSTLADQLAAAALSRKADPAGEEARKYLRRQMDLLDLQIRHFDEDYGLRRLGERLKIGIQFLFILTGALIVTSFGALVWSASRSQNVVVDAFDAPPALAQRGESGRVVASGVLDELTKIQEATRSAAAKRAITGAWASDIKIEIPETGISLGELQHTLRENLGSDLHIGGSLVQTPDDGLALTVRGGSVLPKTFAGANTDLGNLTREAAEYVYGQAEPYLYAIYLINSNRNADADRFLAQAYSRASDAERPDLANAWGNALAAQGRIKDAIAKYRLAMALTPHFWKAWSNLFGALAFTEGEESSYRAGLQMRALAKSSRPDEQPSPIYWQNFDFLVQDWQAELRDLEADARFNNGAGTSSTIDGPAMAEAAAQMHDWQGVARYLAASDPEDPLTGTERLLVAGYRAIETGNFAAAIAPLEAFRARWLNDPSLRYTSNDLPCTLGLAYAMTGRMAEAEAVFRESGRWVRCYSYRAEAIERAGNWRGAIKAYRAALALAPSLPFAYDRWGLSLLRHGDLDGATAAFREANERGPHWAEPLKHWGDVLMRRHRYAEALSKYAAARVYAPAWDALRAAQAQARRRMHG